MAVKSNLKNMVLCLTAVSFVCSAILAATNHLTEVHISLAAENNLKSALQEVLPQGDPINPEARFGENGGVSFEYYVQGSDSLANYAVKSTVAGFGGPLTVLVGVCNSGKIYAAKVLSHSETPGLGAKCRTDRHFISQFEGFDPAEKRLLVRKDGGDIDAITASTITSRAYTLAVSAAVNFVRSLNPVSNE